MIGVIALLAAVVAMAMRSVGAWSFVIPLAGGAAAILAVPTVDRSSVERFLPVTIAGMAAFALVRIAHPAPSLRATTFGLLASVLAGIGEELLFRHGLYSVLERKGALVAVIGSAVAFGLVHAPMYGWSVVPLDVGAGLVFGWQRWATARLGPRPPRPMPSRT